MVRYARVFFVKVTLYSVYVYIYMEGGPSVYHGGLQMMVDMTSSTILNSRAIDPFRIRRATSVPLGKGTKFALHHGKMSTTKRRAIQILHISTFQFTFKCGYNDFISKYTDSNKLHVTQINLLHNNTCCST